MTAYGFTVMLVVFGVTLAVFDLVLLALTPQLIAFLSRRPSLGRAEAMLYARSAPVAASLLFSTCVVLPAWFRFEPAESGETVSAALLAAAFLSLLPIFHGMRLGVRMFLKTRDRLISWKVRGHRARTVSDFDVVEVRSEDLALCVGGYLRPTIYASTDVLRSLGPDEFKAALAHEESHATSRDPLRLLWMGSCPDFLRLLDLDQPWRRAFSSASEFAADECASRGDRERALDLASALVKVARLRAFAGPPRAAAEMALSSAFSNRAELAARVRALANTDDSNAQEGSGPAARIRALRPWMWLIVVVAVCGAGAAGGETVHGVTEAVGAFLAPR
jgi:beta-lactamase regulating signal transducer with metallopeptidase domain